MKFCPKCDREYYDESLSFCLEDGETLVSFDRDSEPATAVLSTSPRSDVTTKRDRTLLLPASTSSRRRYFIAAALGIAALLAIVIGVYFYSRQTPSRQINSIAVLPFQNKSTDADTEYLSQGLAESLIYRLSQLKQLDVTPTSTVLRYQDKDIDPIQVGKELGVSAVLSGRIVQHGENLVISADLVDVRNNKLIWGEQYDRKISELLSTQREIAREIVDTLKLKVAGDEKGLTKTYTDSNEAYQLYLKGRFYWDKRTGDANVRAIGYFEQAIETDPNFALAYAGLADCYVVPSNQLPVKEAMPKAKAAAKRALELDDTLAEAHTALARVLAAYDWDWPAAEKEFRRAIELDPRYPVAHQWYGGYLEAMGRHDEAIAERKLALSLDPLSLILNFELGLGFYYARDYDKAIEQFQKTLELDPNFAPAYQFLPAAYEQKGKYDEAIAQFKASPAADRPNEGSEGSLARAGLAHVYALNGQKQEALALVEELERQAALDKIPATSVALAYAGLGEKDRAFASLEKAYEAREFQLQWLSIEPRWDNLKSDPRFQDLLRRIGLPQ